MTDSAAPITASPPAAGKPLRRAGADPENTLKTLAKNLARDATADIADRHLRARVRTSCYNQVVNVLRQLDHRHAAQRERYRRVLAVLGSVTVLVSAAFALSLAL